MSKHNVFVDSRSVIHKGSGDKAIASAPDVCKTPAGSAVVPIPYPNISQSSDLKGGSKSVKINGKPAATKASTFESSNGDQAGSLGGVISGTTGKKTGFLSYSFGVKFEGKNVVRHADMTTHNNKNTMGMVLGSAAMAAMIKDDEEAEEVKTYKCDWKNCEGKHSQEIEYPKQSEGCVVRGKATSGKDYEKEWISQGLEPWQVNGQGESINPTYNDYADDLDAAKDRNLKIINKALALPSNQYITQKHHLISVHLFDDVPELSHNAKLIGYNANDKENGICLPYFLIDILRHNLQCHRGPHPEATTHPEPPAYDNNVLDLLSNLQNEMKGFCTNDEQDDLLEELNDISERIAIHVNAWEEGWYLRSSALRDRAWAEKRKK